MKPMTVALIGGGIMLLIFSAGLALDNTKSFDEQRAELINPNQDCDILKNSATSYYYDECIRLKELKK